MSKIRFPEINEAMLKHPRFDEWMNITAEMYAASPNKGQVAFVHAFQDQFRINVQSQSISARRSSSGGSTWRKSQEARFAGRGNKWVKVTGILEHVVRKELDRFDTEGHDTGDYRRWTANAGYSWIRYSGPRGSIDNQMLGFEVRINGSRPDHPGHIVKIHQVLWSVHGDDRSLLGGTPFSLALES